MLTRLLVVWMIGVRQPRQHEDPGQHHEDKVGVSRDDLQDRQHIEQHRQFELVGEAVGDLLGALRPVRLARARSAKDAPRARPNRCAQRNSQNKQAEASARPRRTAASRTNWIGMIRSATRIQLLAEIRLPAASRDQRARRLFEPLHDILAILDPALLSQCDTSRRKSSRRAAKSRDDEAAHSEPLGQHRCASAAAAVMGPAAARSHCSARSVRIPASRANGLSSGNTASNTAPPTFSK